MCVLIYKMCNEIPILHTNNFNLIHQINFLLANILCDKDRNSSPKILYFYEICLFNKQLN